MRVWTIQPGLVWARLKLQGFLYVDPILRVPNSIPDEELSLPWRWLTSELSHRVPGSTGRLPWWSWTHKPDLRTYRHRHYGLHVRLELELEEQKILEFPSWAWHRIFCEEYLPLDPEEVEPSGERTEDVLAESWSRLFDPSLPKSGRDDMLGELTTSEVVFEALNLRDVVHCSPFYGISRLWHLSNPICRPQVELSEEERVLLNELGERFDAF